VQILKINHGQNFGNVPLILTFGFEFGGNFKNSYKMEVISGRENLPPPY